MEYNTSELCNIYADLIDVLEPIFSNYGGRNSFGGQVVTVKCFENNGLIHDLLSQDGEGKVLVIDGGGSTRRALIDIEIAELATNNNWEGIICYGSVRDVDLYQLKKWFAHSARIKRLRGKALIAKNGYSLVKINNAAYKPFKLALGSLSEAR